MSGEACQQVNKFIHKHTVPYLLGVWYVSR